jgi:hypothetical protein
MRPAVSRPVATVSWQPAAISHREHGRIRIECASEQVAKKPVITRVPVDLRGAIDRCRIRPDRGRKRRFGGEGENRTPDLGVMNPSL